MSPGGGGTWRIKGPAYFRFTLRFELLFEDKSSQLSVPAAMLPHHDGFSSLWNREFDKLFPLCCLGHG